MKNAMSFFKLAAMLSLAFFAFEATGVFPSRGYDWARFLRLYVLMVIFVMTPYPGKINVHDVITNEDRVLSMADKKIPFGLIVPVAMASTITNRLINLYQQNFEIDSNLNYTYSGMNFGANFITALDNVDSYDANFNYNFDMYMQNCGFPLTNKAGALSELRASKDIFATLQKYTSDARFVQNVDFTEGKTNIVMSCKQALDAIVNHYDNNADKIMQANAQMMGTAPSQYERFVNSANATSSTLLGISQGASAALKQAIGMNMMMASLKNGAHAAGNGTLALAAYDAEAFQEYKKSSELSGSASARSVPILVGIGFTMLFFLYPIMIFMAITMGSYRVIGGFFRIIVCINLIPLMYEIINYMTTFYLQKKLGTLTITGQGYTYDLSASIYSFTDNMIIASNWLATSTPILAWALVSGAETAVSSVFGHINDPAKTRAEQAGNDLALGNQNMGNANIDNQSFNNLSSNKLDDQFSMNSGAAMMKTNTGNGVRTNIGGNDFDVQYKNQLLSSVNVGQMAQHSLQNALNSSKQTMSQQSQSWGSQQQKLQDLSNNLQSGADSSSSTGNRELTDVAHAQQLASRIGADLSIGAKFMGTGAGVNAGLSSNVSDSLSKNLNEYKDVSERLSHSSNQSVRDAFSSSQSLTDSTSHTVNTAVSSSKALSDMQSTSSTVSTDFSNDYANYLRKNSGVQDISSLTATQEQKYASEFVSKYINDQYGIKTNLDAPSSHVGNPVSNKSLTNDIKVSDNASSIQSQSNDLQGKFTTAKDNLENHKANALGQQIVTQAETTADVMTGDNYSKLKNMIQDKPEK